MTPWTFSQVVLFTLAYLLGGYISLAPWALLTACVLAYFLFKEVDTWYRL